MFTLSSFFSVTILYNESFFLRMFFAIFVILLSIYNIKIFVLIVSFLNESECTVLRVIVFTSTDMSMMFVMSFFLFLINLIRSNSTPTFISSSLTSCCLKTFFSSVSLFPKFFFNSFSDKEDSFKILDSSLLKSSSLSPIVLSR